MRLKEIKQGMAIMCHNFEQGEAVVKQLNSQGAGLGHFSPHFTDEHRVVYLNFDNQYSFWNRYDATCEFSDLILPELTAEELLQVINDICNTYSNCSCDCKKECPFCNGYCKEWMAKHPKDTIEICAQWKSEHEKKEPEIEWVYRVFGAENYGEKFFQTEEEAIKRCEELAKSQKTKQYARYERICRVKAV